MTDEQAVKGRWPGVWQGITGIWTNASCELLLGYSWHKARQHPTVVQWEREQPKGILRVANECQDQLRAAKATIAEQATRIEELEKELFSFRMDLWECRDVVTHQNFVDMQRRAEASEARVVELEAKLKGARSVIAEVYAGTISDYGDGVRIYVEISTIKKLEAELKEARDGDMA